MPTNPNPSSRRLALQLAAFTTLVSIAPAGAATFTYTPAAGSGDLWSAGTNWDAVPVSATDTRLTFVADNATVLADALGNANTDDIAGEFSLNILDLQGTGPAAGGGSITINASAPATGLTLATGLAAPVVNLNALAGGSGLTYRVNPLLTLANDATFTGAGTAGFKFSGGLSGAGRTLTKTGASEMSIGGASSLETLLVGFNTTGGKITAEAGSSLSVGTGTGFIRIGSTNAANATGALDLSTAGSFTANVAELQVGVNFGGSAVTGGGTLNLSSNNTITASSNVSFGRSGGNFNTPLATGTAPNDSLTSINTPVFTIGQGKSNGVFTAGSNAEFDLAGISGARSEFRVSYNDQTGSGNWTGSADFGNAIFRGTLSSFSIGRKTMASTGNANGTASFSANEQNNFNLSNTGIPLVIGRADAGTTGVATGSLSVGHLGFSSSITSTNNSTAILIGTGAGTIQRAVGTLNLGAGILTLNTTGAGIAGDATNLLNTSTVKFDGTTLVAGGSNGSWINSLTQARISNGGLTINTNGFNVTVPQGLSHDPAGAALDGGLTKESAGVLSLTSTNSYTGPTTVNAGILFLGKTASLPGFATPGMLTVAEFAGLGMNVGGAGEFTLAQLESYRTDGTFEGTNTYHPLILDTANAGGDLSYTSALTQMGSFAKRGINKLTLGHDVDMKGSLDVGLNNNGGTLAIAAGKDFSLTPSDISGMGTMNLGVATGATNSLGTLDASAADSFSMEVSTLRMGTTIGAGTAGGNLSLPPVSSITAHTDIVIADSNNTFNNVNSTITTAAGGTATIRTPRLWIGHGKGRGFFTLGSGSTLDLAYLDGGRTSLEVGNNPINGGSGGWSGTANFAAGVFKGRLSNLLIGAINATSASSSVVGTMTLSNNPLNHLDIEGAGTPLIIGSYAGSTTGTATGTLTLGNLDAASTITHTAGGTAILIGTGGTGVKATGTLNLDGGSLTITTTGSAIRGDAANAANLSTVNFNGITLRAGAASADWMGNLSTANLATNGLTLDTNGFEIGINQVLSGSGSLTKTGAGTLILFAANSYTGSTTVSAGTLSLADEMLADTAAVSVAADARLSLGYPATTIDTVQSLSLAGSPASAGIWGAEGSGAPHTSPLITGTGRLNVLTGPGGDAYDTWAAQIPNPADRDRADDPDHDGFSNELEFLFGASPLAAEGSLLQGSIAGANLVIRWNQLESGGIYQLQESSTLLDSPWPVSAVIPAAAADQSGVPSGYDRMEAILPIGGARKFVRVSGIED